MINNFELQKFYLILGIYLKTILHFKYHYFTYYYYFNPFPINQYIHLLFPIIIMFLISLLSLLIFILIKLDYYIY